MNRPSKLETSRERDALRQHLAGPAWSLWTTLARRDAMGGSNERDAMMERHKIVVSIIEINSQQLRCDSLSAGLDIERLCALRDAERPGHAPEAGEVLADIERRTRDVEERKRKLKVEREWLEQSLAEFDQSHPAASSIIKHQ